VEQPEIVAGSNGDALIAGGPMLFAHVVERRSPPTYLVAFARQMICQDSGPQEALLATVARQWLADGY
jgi:hypothetical protein